MSGRNRPNPPAATAVAQSAKREKKGPSAAATAAVGSILAILEGLSVSDRGYASNRIAHYLTGKTVRECKAGGEAKPHASEKASKRTKSDWKAKWIKSEDYLRWQSFIAAHKNDSAEQRKSHQAEFLELRQRAFRARPSPQEDLAEEEEEALKGPPASESQSDQGDEEFPPLKA